MTKFLFILTFIFTGSFSVFAQVFINQGGYLPGAPKYVFSNQSADSFYVRDVQTQEIHFRGNVSLFLGNDAATDMSIYRGDFSDFQSAGKYYVELAGTGNSFPFAISDTVCQSVYEKALKAFYFHRVGVDLLGEYAAPYFRSRGHVADGFFHPSTGKSGFNLSRGGWYDAGDYGKYIVNASITTGTMQMAYEEFPMLFGEDNLNIPENGNGVPDILDEIRFELEWFLTMQDASSGGVHHKLTRETFTGFVMPANDNGTRYIYEISSTATADFAAVMARAYRIFLPFDATFAQSCLDAAAAAWGFLDANPNIVPAGGFSNPSGTNTGQYGDGNDQDERLWAAAELYLASGETGYHTYFLSNYSNGGLITGEMAWPNVKTLALLTYLRGNQTGISEVAKTLIRSSLDTYCQSLISTIQNRGFHVAMSPGEYNWGCNSRVLNRAILLIFGYEELDNPVYVEAAFEQLSYTLGVNAHNISFVTGVGEQYPMSPHHRLSEADGIEEPIPGFIAGGPDQYLSDPVLQSNFSSATPPALCYIDELGSYASNEFAINWNAPLVFVAGYFSKNSPLTSLNPAPGTVPERSGLFQNYPNPFNGQTTFEFQLTNSSPVTIEIYDSLGKSIYSESLGTLSPGVHQYRWDSRNSLNEDISSGVYYYTLRGSEFSYYRKMVYIR